MFDFDNFSYTTPEAALNEINKAEEHHVINNTDEILEHLDAAIDMYKQNERDRAPQDRRMFVLTVISVISSVIAAITSIIALFK